MNMISLNVGKSYEPFDVPGHTAKPPTGIREDPVTNLSKSVRSSGVKLATRRHSHRTWGESWQEGHVSAM
jgi:hypothetical protein